jgi:DNA replication protein DnaC
MEPIRDLIKRPRLQIVDSDPNNAKAIIPIAPLTQVAPLPCPTCGHPLSETTHGWMKDYGEHYNHEGHHRKFGYCEVPCPSCSAGAEQRAAIKRQQEMVSRLFGSSHIPHQARSWEFKTYPQGADEAARLMVQKFVRRHLAGDEDSKRGLWIAGAAGRCKTGLAISAIKEVMRAGELALFVMTLELMNRLRASFGKESNESRDELLEAVTHVPWLVLDDIATERPTPYVLEQFYYIIEKRKSQGLYTIFTSNLSTKDLMEYWRPEHVQVGSFHPGLRVVERIREYCEGCAVGGRNQRQSNW